MELYDSRNGLWGNFVSYITEDYRGNIWVASMEDQESRGGITIFSPDGIVDLQQQQRPAGTAYPVHDRGQGKEYPYC